MASQAQITANQSNAKRSTGPKTAGGRQASSRNSTRHGLAARETNLYFNNALDQEQFLAHKETLRKELLPVGPLEEKFFHLHAFSLFQAERSQVFELACEEAWLEDQTNPILISNLQRMARYGEIHERRAAKSLQELRKLQFDRFAATEVGEFITFQGESTAISRALPLSTIRKSDLHKTNPSFIAGILMASDPIIQARPKPDPKDAPKIDWLALHSRATNQAEKSS